MKKRALVAACAAVSVYILASCVGAAVAMRIPRLPVTGSPASVRVAYEDVSFPARSDHALLRGWYLPGNGKGAVIIVHGGFQNRVDEVVDTLNLARDLVARGYSLLLFDLRGRGDSSGRARALTKAELDIGGAVDYLGTRGHAEGSIALLGFCSGAASCAVYASQNGIGALILDGCFPTVTGMVSSEAVASGIPQGLVGLFIPGLRVAAWVIYRFVPTDPVHIIPGVRCPVLFIHEARDNVVSLEDTAWLVSQSRNPANDSWEIASADHSRGYAAGPVEFVDRIDRFLGNTMR